MALVLVDTNIIIESVRTGAWKAISGHHSIETVSTCVAEAVTGDKMRVGYVAIDRHELESRLAATHNVTERLRAGLALKNVGGDALDDGERDLFAHAITRTDVWRICCADRAAVRVACNLGWAERIVSLESIVRAAGAKPKLKDHFTERWLADVRTRFRLDMP